MPSSCLHEGNVLQDITGTGLHQNSANVSVFQRRASGCSSLPPGTAQNRALPNTPTVIKAHYRAIPNSPDQQPQGSSPQPGVRSCCHYNLWRCTASGPVLVTLLRQFGNLQCLMQSSRFTKVKQLCLLYRCCSYRLINNATARDAVMQGCLPQACAYIN